MLDNIGSFQSLTAIATALFAGVGLFFNWAAIRAQMRTSRAEKQVDVIMECNRRYEHASAKIRTAVNQFRVFQARGDSAVSFRELVVEPFRIYWLVFYEEWQFFTVGMVPSPYFRQWCMGLVRNFAAPQMEGFGTISLTQAWELFGNSSWGYTGPFVRHVDRLRKIARLPEVDWESAVTAAIAKTAQETKDAHHHLGR